MCKHNNEGEQQINHFVGLPYPINASFTKGLRVTLGCFSPIFLIWVFWKVRRRRWLFLDSMLCANSVLRCCDLAFLFLRSSKFVHLHFESMVRWRPFLGKAGRWLLLFFVVHWLGMAQPRLYVSDTFKFHPGHVHHQSLLKGHVL